MDNNIQKHFTCNFKQILIDEIALEGLEGIGINYLWKRVEKRLSLILTQKMKIRFWQFIINRKSILLYHLPEPVPYIEVVDRFMLIDDVTGYVKDPDDYIDGPYEYNLVDNEYGSCKYYNTRKTLPRSQLQKLSFDKVMGEYGDTLVMVASIEERWHALAGHMPMISLPQLSPIHYCILELVGRGRENGQMTFGKTNITKIVKEPKFLFYNRKVLQDLDLIRVQYVSQVVAERGVKCLLLRLKKFHQPSILSLPKVGILYNLVEYLKAQPDYSEKTDVLFKKDLLTPKQSKRLRKTVNVFNFDERLDDSVKTKKQKSGIKRRFITLTAISDESQSEDEAVENPLPCQHKIGVSLIRQAYERLIEAGLKGLTQIEMAQLLGIEFYTSRTICRVLKSHHIVREYLEDKGKQRTARFVAVAATGKLDCKYAEEKKKFLEYLDKKPTNTSLSTSETPSTSTDTTVEAIREEPAKAIKSENSDTVDNSMNTENIENVVTEMKLLDGCESALNKSLLNSKKTLTLRQLRFANGILKVINQKLTISGYQTLSHLVSQAINEPPMDAKALKAFIQKLVTDRQLKIMKVKWPGFQHKYTVFICAPHIKTTDPIIKAKYKEITLKAFSNKKIKVKQELTKKPATPLTQISYPRFMRIRKFHEFLVNFAYFDPVAPESHDLPAGFVSVVDVLPEITVEFALGNISNVCKLATTNVKLNDGVLELKLRYAPPELCKALLQSKSLHNTLRFNLKVLAMLGLIQLVYQPAVQSADYNNIGLSSFLFYVNRNAKIIDTTGIWPRANRVDTGTQEKLFHFDTIDDVKYYWSVVYSISTNTTITVKQREKKNLRPPVRVENEVSNYDNGDRYGDGNGPCGFDSCFYMELPRLWSTFIIRATKNQKQMSKKVAVKLPKLETYKKQRIRKPKKPVKQVVEKVKTNVKLTRRRHGDVQINWSKQEDTIIMMCKAAINIMSPSSQPGCLKVRNIVSKDILTIKDPKKTQSACHRRALTLESNATLVHEKECILNEMRRRRNLIQKYEGLLKKIRIRYPTNLSKFMNEARLPMLELVWVINQLVQSKIYSQKVPCIALNIEAFQDAFTIVPSTSNKSCNIYKSPECPVLKEAIMLTVMHSYNNDMKTDIARKIYAMFKTYPENTLRQAIEQLRKCGAIAAKEKLVNNNLHRINLEDLVQSSYKISASYQRRWICRLNSEFINQLGEVLVTEVPQSGVIGSPEINCLFCEMHACDVLDIVSSTIPVIAGISESRIQDEQLNVLDIEVKIKLKSGTLGWKPKHNMNIKVFSESYQSLQSEDVFQALSNSFIVNTEGRTSQSEDEIVIYLRKKAEAGATFKDLEENCGYETNTLTNKLLELESNNIIKRVGFHENIIVLIDYVKSWTMNINNKSFIPTPWLTVDSELRYDVFLKWAGVVMNKIFECPGCSISYLSDACEFLAARSIQDICMFLEKCECVKVHTLKPPVPDLFTDDDIFDSELKEFNQYESPENILIFPVINSLTKFAYFRKKMLDHLSVK